MRLTLEIVARTLFDAEMAGEAADAREAMETLTHAFVARTGNLLTPPHWIPRRSMFESSRPFAGWNTSLRGSSPRDEPVGRIVAICCRCFCRPEMTKAAGK